MAVIFGALTAWLGYMLLSREYVYDIWMFVLCFVIAKCQFSLLKVNLLYCILCFVYFSCNKVPSYDQITFPVFYIAK